jgi:hypothetical protein
MVPFDDANPSHLLLLFQSTWLFPSLRITQPKFEGTMAILEPKLTLYFLRKKKNLNPQKRKRKKKVTLYLPL